MDEKEAADECNATAQKEEGVSILHFLEFDASQWFYWYIFRTQQVHL